MKKITTITAIITCSIGIIYFIGYAFTSSVDRKIEEINISKKVEVIETKLVKVDENFVDIKIQLDTISNEQKEGVKEILNVLKEHGSKVAMQSLILQELCKKVDGMEVFENFLRNKEFSENTNLK